MSVTDLLPDLLAYVGFDDRDAETLSALGPLLKPSFEGIVDDFYEAIIRTPRAMAVFRGGEAQIQRQKDRLREWLVGIFSGVYDDDYLQRRARIGRVHVQIRLEQRYMFGAMNLIRRGLHRALDGLAAEVLVSATEGDGEDVRAEGHVAIDKICDIELAVMLETYRNRYVEQQREQERLATLGQMAASIGHELRNPLAVISTSTHLLRRRLAEDDRTLKHADKIHRQVGISERIIGDLLALAGDRAPQLERVDLVALVQEACDSVAVADRVTVTPNVDPGLRSLELDGAQLRQVLINLLTNAVQAVEEEGGNVELNAEVEDGVLHIEVLDDGPGFPPGMIERIFEPLFTTKSGGIGLGLALCARIIEKHGGTLAAADREGGGAHISVRLPNVLGNE